MLLHRHLVSIFKKRNQVLKIKKNGSKILNIKLPQEIYFVDILDMLSPGCSLAKLAKLTNQSECKLIFPFRILTSPKSLNESQLPTDKKMWFNDLTQEQFTDEEIATAHAKFKETGAKNVGEYLKIYLKMDVKLTVIGVQRLLEKYFDQYQVHPYDINKTTIASYGSFLFQHNLMENKKPAVYSPNTLPMYTAIKNSSTGGLTLAMRHSADSTCLNECPINSHLSPEFQNKVEGVAALDVTSLYPTAAMQLLPFGPGYFLSSNTYNKDLSLFGIDADSKLQNVLKTNSLNIDKYSSKLMNSQESQVVQFLLQQEYKNSIYCFSRFHAGPGQCVFGRNHHKYVDMLVVKDYGKIDVIQYHEQNTHYKADYKHSSTCLLSNDNDKSKGEKNQHLDSKTRRSDTENLLYAKYMTDNLMEYKVEFNYKVYDECDFFHKKYTNNQGDEFDTPMDYLVNSKHKNDVVFKPSWLDKKTIMQDELMDKIMNSTELDAGFVVLKKMAKENANDQVSDHFAFCLQRSAVSLSDIGQGNEKLIRDLYTNTTVREENETDEKFTARVEGKVQSHLRNRLKNEFTYTRKHFQEDQCLPVMYFKFLKNYRNLDNVTFIHVIHYEGRDYARNFICNLLQARHDIKFSLKGLPDTLESLTLKLMANSIYGQFLMEIIKYFKYTYVTDKSINNNKNKFKNVDLNFITVIPTKNKKKRKYAMIFQAKHDQKDAAIKNLAHLGATILGNSRAIFYYQIFTLLKYLNPSMAQNCYIDTDSMFWALGNSDLKKCVLPNLLDEFEIKTKNMFVDPNSKQTQAGKLKLEGFYKAGYFKCIKNYILIPFEQSSLKKNVKSKGMAYQIQNKMEKEHFEMNNFAAEQLFFQNYKLHPTVGSEQIFLSLQKRKMTNALNCKRKLVYQSDFDSPETVGKCTGTIKLIILFTFFSEKILSYTSI